MKTSSGFLGTYYDKNAVLQLERWVRLFAWIVLVVYMFDAGTSVFQSVYNALMGGFGLDWMYLITLLSRAVQGIVIFFVMQVAAKILLILLDIEDNTRRAARVNSSQG